MICALHHSRIGYQYRFRQCVGTAPPSAGSSSLPEGTGYIPNRVGFFYDDIIYFSLVFVDYPVIWRASMAIFGHSTEANASRLLGSTGLWRCTCLDSHNASARSAPTANSRVKDSTIRLSCSSYLPVFASNSSHAMEAARSLRKSSCFRRCDDMRSR